MPRFFIDVHADSLSEWDDHGEELLSANDAVTLAGELALSKLTSFLDVGVAGHAVAVIRDEANLQIATVTVGARGEPKVVWGPAAKRSGLR